MEETVGLKSLKQFPWLGRFESKTEIDEYLSGDKVQCLLCGKLFKALPPHLERTHNITADDYREQNEVRNRFEARNRFLQYHAVSEGKATSDKHLQQKKFTTHSP